jgi:hypothetical protein
MREAGSSPEEYARARPTPGAFDTLADVSPRLFEGRVHLISQCTPEIEAVKREWLIRQEFHEQARIPPEALHFCRKPEDKARICLDLGVTDFVDDRAKILSYAISCVNHLYLFNPNEDELREYNFILLKAYCVQNWTDLRAMLEAHAD